MIHPLRNPFRPIRLAVAGWFLAAVLASSQAASSPSLGTMLAGSLELLSWEPSVVGVPIARTASLGGRLQLVLPIVHIAVANYSYQWFHNGRVLAGRNQLTLDLENLQPSDAGIYTVRAISPADHVFSYSYVVGIAPAAKITGTATEVLSNVVHPNGNTFDQVLLTGPSATVRADPGQIVRVSFVDLSDDIVQVEFTGAGALTVNLTDATGPAYPVKYDQPVRYMRGHAAITLTGADESTHLSVFSVGRLNAVDPTGSYRVTHPANDANDPARNGNPIFRAGEQYDGIADIALIALGSTNGRFGILACGNTGFLAASGITGVYAPLVHFRDLFAIHDVNAAGDAIPALLTGAIGDRAAHRMPQGIAVCGGDMLQLNGRAVQVGDAGWIRFTAGRTSHNGLLPAQQNRATYTRYGVDVTAQLVLWGPL